MDQSQITWITNYIWGIADDVLRDLYVRGKYRDVILPMTVLRRLDAVLEPTKQSVLDLKATLDKAGVVNQEQALRGAAAQAFYNTSRFTMRDLRSRASQQQLRADFEAYLDGFSADVQDILDSFEFRNQVPKLSRADAIGTLIEKLVSPDINLSPNPVHNGDGSVRHPGLDNHGMGTIFEELVRRFNEENNEEAGEHWTPRDAVRLMANLVFLPIADKIESGTYLLYDGACGTGGMLTVAEETLRQLAAERGKQVATHLYGQEINALMHVLGPNQPGWHDGPESAQTAPHMAGRVVDVLGFAAIRTAAELQSALAGPTLTNDVAEYATAAGITTDQVSHVTRLLLLIGRRDSSLLPDCFPAEFADPSLGVALGI